VNLLLQALSHPTLLEHDDFMRLTDPRRPATLMPLEGMTAGAGSPMPATKSPGRRSPRERVSVDLRGLAPQLKSYAAAHRRTPAAAIRLVLVQELAQSLESKAADDCHDANGAEVSAKTATAGAIQANPTKVTLRMPADMAACLARRARASEMSQGAFVSALLDGYHPAPPPASHDAAIQALTKSTDHLAVLSADLNGFLRSVGQLPHVELQRYRASLVSVVEDVRQHLAQASTLIAALRAARRGRR